ncbi:MAG: transcription elongation factor GreA [Chloroherpetonaceae bacterium]|nr:transcription elongation factor GreA [bacterium]
MSDTLYLTKQRLQELEDELQYLTTVRRREVAQKIADARSHGDLSENGDYDAAKDEQGMLEMKISKIGEILASAQVISSDQFSYDKVHILSKVQIKNLDNGEIFEYNMVSPEESDFEKNKISVTSLVGKALMGKVVGDKVQIKVPAGILNYEILNISKID